MPIFQGIIENNIEPLTFTKVNKTVRPEDECYCKKTKLHSYSGSNLFYYDESVNTIKTTKTFQITNINNEEINYRKTKLYSYAGENKFYNDETATVMKVRLYTEQPVGPPPEPPDVVIKGLPRIEPLEWSWAKEK